MHLTHALRRFGWQLIPTLKIQFDDEEIRKGSQQKNHWFPLAILGWIHHEIVKSDDGLIDVANNVRLQLIDIRFTNEGFRIQQESWRISKKCFIIFGMESFLVKDLMMWENMFIEIKVYFKDTPFKAYT